MVLFFLGVIQEWVNSGQKESPDELANILRKVLSTLKSLYIDNWYDIESVLLFNKSPLYQIIQNGECSIWI